MKRPYKIETLIPLTSNAFSITVYDKEGNANEILPPSAGALHIDEEYADWAFFGPYDYDESREVNIQRAKERISNLFSLWTYEMQDGWNKTYQAFTTEYGPLENVDEYIDPYDDTSEMHKGTKTVLTSTPGVQSESDTYRYGGNDGATKVPVDAMTSFTVSGQDKTETEIKDIDDTHFDKTITKHAAYHRHGNIGVTKSQDMVNSEYELRQRNLAYSFLDAFFRHYCFYSSALEGSTV